MSRLILPGTGPQSTMEELFAILDSTLQGLHGLLPTRVGPNEPLHTLCVRASMRSSVSSSLPALTLCRVLCPGTGHRRHPSTAFLSPIHLTGTRVVLHPHLHGRSGYSPRTRLQYPGRALRTSTAGPEQNGAPSMLDVTTLDTCTGVSVRHATVRMPVLWLRYTGEACGLRDLSSLPLGRRWPGRHRR